MWPGDASPIHSCSSQNKADRSSAPTLAPLPRGEETFSLGRKRNVSFSVFFWESIQAQGGKKKKRKHPNIPFQINWKNKVHSWKESKGNGLISDWFQFQTGFACTHTAPPDCPGCFPGDGSPLGSAVLFQMGPSAPQM